MTYEEAKANQERIAEHFSLSFWYGTDCEKCCGVYPKFITSGGTSNDVCWYECEVCGTKTEPQTMEWLAKKVWNERKFKEIQMKLF